MFKLKMLFKCELIALKMSVPGGGNISQPEAKDEAGVI